MKGQAEAEPIVDGEGCRFLGPWAFLFNEPERTLGLELELRF